MNEGFPSCHEYEEASTCAVARLLPAYAGMQMQREVEMLGTVLDDPARPLVLIMSGAKMETKIPVIKRFLNKGDDILLGGCIANTFIAARGFDVGSSTYQEKEIPMAQEIMLESEKKGRAVIHVPRDVIVASAPVDGAEKICLPVEDIVGDMSIFDIGKVTIYSPSKEIAGLYLHQDYRATASTPGDQPQRYAELVDDPYAPASGKVEVALFVDAHPVRGGPLLHRHGGIEEHFARSDRTVGLNRIRAPVHRSIVGHIERLTVVRDFEAIGNLHVFDDLLYFALGVDQIHRTC